MPPSMSAAVETPVPDEPNPTLAPQLPWNSIPKFVPGVTNVQEYTQKMRFLAAMWPDGFLNQLAPRAALLVEGTAFRKVARLDPAKLRVNDTSGVALLVSAIGGSWGATELEERYEYFEKALYGTVQRQDESHDSFLARMESNFVELLSRETKLEEVQAYVLLRQSLLSPEDKKKILLEHAGELKYEPVVKSFRLLGSKFFSELQGGRATNKTKVYDANVSESLDMESSRASDEHGMERAFMALTEDVEPELDQEYLDIMVAAEDQDALVVHNFEQELEDFLQDVPEMHDAMVTYLEARSKLLEKRRSRGFWPVKVGGKDGKSFGRGKGRGKGKKQREQLLARIARSTCRICHQKGHWKAECPNRDKNSESGPAASANIAEEFQLSAVQEVHSEPDSSDPEPESRDMSMPSKFLPGFNDNVADVFVVQALQSDTMKANFGARMKQALKPKLNRFVSALMSPPRYSIAMSSSRTKRPVSSEAVEPLPDVCNIAAANDRPCHAILDTGASRCVIGEKVWNQLHEQLPESLQKKVRKTPSKVKFRFGNNQTLQSEYQVQVPLQSSPQHKRKLWLSIEVLPGHTPFLFSKRAFKQLGGILDTTQDVCYLQRLDRKIHLELNPTELYLLDVLQLCAPTSSFFKRFSPIHHDRDVRSRGCDPTYGSHDDPKQIESISLTMAKPVSKDSAVPASEVPTSDSHHAVGANDELPEDGGRGSDQPSHHAVAVSDSSAGEYARRFRQPTRDDANDGRDGSRAAEPACHAAKPHVPKSTESCCPKFNWKFNRSRRITKDSNCTLPTKSVDRNSQYRQSASDVNKSGPKSSTTCRPECCREHHSSDDTSVKLGDAGGGRSDRGPGRTPDRTGSSSASGGLECLSVGSNQQSGCSNSQSLHANDSRRLGSMQGHLGKETPWPNVCSGSANGSRVCPMGPGPIQQPDTRHPRLCKVLPGTDRLGSECLGSTCSMIDPQRTFHDEVKQTQQKLSQSDSPELSNQELEKSIYQANQILQEAFMSPAWSVPHRQCVLLEIYADLNSPLTNAVQAMGHFALRFTRQDGDLSTTEGQRKLWQLIDKHQPLNIWVAPECGPWGGWSRLNMFKSVALFDRICSWQQQELKHVDLCAALCSFQKQRNREFHLEQPNGSTMPQLRQFQPIYSLTSRASFDMCMFGLRHPQSKRFLRKSSQLFSTNWNFVKQLSKAKCDHKHMHQPIEGSVSANGLRIPLTRFCATYCSGFAKKVAEWMIRLCFPDALVGEHEEEPPAKRTRFTFNPNKRFKSQHVIDLDSDTSHNPFPESNEPVEPSLSEQPNKEAEHTEGMPIPSQPSANVPRPDVQETPQSDRWKAVFQVMETLAPRVGKIRIDSSHEVFLQFQELLPQMDVHVIYVGRGMERFQVPLDLPNREQNIMRHTVCLHRMTGNVHDFGMEQWSTQKRSQRIRNAVPSKLMITCFGSRKTEPEVAVPSAPRPPEPDQSRVSEQRVSQPAGVRASSVSQKEVCEGWAPPPVALHGPKFRELTSQEKSDLRKLHLNLGHPDPNVLAEHLKAQSAAPHVVAAARDFVCDACVESVGRKHQRPAKLHDPKDFNDTVGIDGFYWTGLRGFQVHVFHCIDEASLFHLGRRCETRNPDQVITTWTNFWTSWAGNPTQVYTDPAGEFVSQEWKDFMQSQSIQPQISTEAWQRGRVERHGQIIKRMLSRCDLERPIGTIQDFDQVLLACFQAKNSLTRQQGFSPEQIVLGKSQKLPASLTSDDSALSHTLALGEEPESELFRRHLERRTHARKAFLLTDNDQAIRRALIHRSCPTRGPYEPGQLVMYWMKRHKSSRQEAGRWHGPAKVILQESQSAIWLSHSDRLFKCAPESIRPASLREWNMFNGGKSVWAPELEPIASENRAPATPAESLAYEPSLAPDHPVPQSPNAMITPNSSIQPESEIFPEPFHDNHEPTVPDVENSDETENPPQEAIDLENTEPAAEMPVPMPILQCSLITDEEQAEELFDWTMLQPGTQEQNVLLAEDGFPVLESPMECHDQQCFALSIDLSDTDVHRWAAAEKPEEMAWVASVGKRTRAEVCVKDLTWDEKLQFEKAKDAELNCWIQTSALKPILRRQLNPEQILKSRWILTWKNLHEEDSSKPQRKAKARLVVLGFQDPKLCEVARDSPTLTREGRHSVLQTIASHSWELASFDIKTAFLRGQSSKDNPLAMEPPAELRKKLDLTQDQVCALVGNAYGRVDAPLLFYKEFSSQLYKLNFVRHPLEPCIFMLESYKAGQRTLHGIIGSHVDDGICGGDRYFYQQLELLKQSLPFGSFKQRKFVFTGIQLEQLPDCSILASQEDYVKSIPAIDIGKHRRQTPDAPVSEDELSKLRGVIGSLQYAVTHTRPDMAAKLGEVQIQIAKATVQTLLLANKVLRETQENSQVKICFRHIPVHQLTHVSFGDASFASAKQLSSFQGTIICATNPDLDKNMKAPISPLSWISKKISRVVRSTLSAEAFSMSNGVDRLGWMRLLWGTINIDKFDWRNPSKGFQQLPVATIVTDCKSLFDLVSRTAMPSCEEFRTTLEVLLIRERCQEHCHFRWIPTALQVADALTKPMDPILLRQVLSSGCFQLYDENDSLERNAHKKQAVRWYKEQTNNPSTQISSVSSKEK